MATLKRRVEEMEQQSNIGEPTWIRMWDGETPQDANDRYCIEENISDIEKVATPWSFIYR